MGVPALFRWLSKKYPKIVSQVKEELPRELENGDGTKTTVPVEMTDPNPNGVEFDNLYLDFNGIVHPCSHPEDRPAPETEEDMMRAIFEYTDRVVNMVRPRNLLYIAVDGVAPRAKMNQQRSRRFKSAQEAAEKDAAAAEHHAMLVATGQRQADDDTDKPKKVWDSNSITPGTPFMNTLALSLRYWINYKQSTDPGWKNLKTIISDASVPGEGEHKIMNFIRSQRQSPTHDPNTRHVMYGLDADLIMLGLVTHEVHFRIIREDVFANDTKPGHCRKCNQPGHIAAHCQGKAAPKPGEGGVDQPHKPYVWLNVEVLREYLAVEMQVPQQPFPFDLERAIDDWVFMCFFVGNDFLPHLPSLDIREDGIDTLIAIWRDNIPFMGGYLTNDGSVDLNKAQRILDGLASQENAIFKRRKENEIQREAAAKRREDHQKRRESNKRPRVSNGNSGPGSRGGKIRGELPPDPDALPIFAPSDAQTRNDPRYAKDTLSHADIVGGKSKAGENKSAAAALKERMMNAAASGGASNGDASQSVLGKRTRDMIGDAAEEASSDPSTPGRHTPINTHDKGTSGQLGGNSTETDAMPEDTVKLWEDGYEDRYYAQKFKVAPDNIEFRRQVARAYTEGLCWVLLYYLQGCPSWTWYYPYHYAPFASDFKDMGSQVVNFEKGKPFRPYEQLMGVLPAASNHAIPLPFHTLMTEEDSPIKEFYPTEFETDLNGKKFAWQGVVLLPFIDEKRLLDAMNTKYPDLSDDERKRNEVGSEVLIVSNDHPMVADLHGSFYGKSKDSDKIKLKQYNCGLAGTVSKDESYMPWGGVQFPLESAVDKFPALETTGSTMASYQMPVSKHLHKSMLLAMVKFDESALDYNDIQKTRQMAKTSGRQFGGVKLTNDGGRSDGRQIHYGARDGHSNGNHHHQQNHNPIANLPPHLAAQAAQHGIMPNMPPGFPAGGPAMPHDYRQPPPRHQDRYPPQSNGYGQGQGYGYGQDRGYGGGYQQNGGYYQGGNGGGYGGGGYGGDRYSGGGYGGSNGQRNNHGGDRYGNGQGYGQNGGQYNGGRGGRRY